MEELEFHLVFPLTLTLPDVICYFQCQEHLDKYVERYKIKKPKITKTKKNAYLKNKTSSSTAASRKPKQTTTRKSVRKVSKPTSNVNKSRTRKTTGK